MLAAGVLLAACGATTTKAAGAAAEASGGGGGTIALLLPESKTARYESQDRPNFESKVKELCSDCEIIYSNADQDAGQAAAAGRGGAHQGRQGAGARPGRRGVGGARSWPRAKQSNVPVISYDRLITDADIDYYISFDNEQVGKLQGESLAEKLEEDGGKGDDRDDQRRADRQQRQAVQAGRAQRDRRERRARSAKEYDTPDWSPDKAQQEMEQAITALGKDGFVGVYAANDGTAGGAIAAMKRPASIPKTIPTTGQDAELAAIQRILAGEQYMTVYKAIKPEAEAAAELAVALVQGRGRRPAGSSTARSTTARSRCRRSCSTPVAVTEGQRPGHDRQGRLLEAGPRSARASTQAPAARPASSQSMSAAAPPGRSGHSAGTEPQP